MFAEYDLPAGSHRIGANRYQEGDHSHCNHRNMELSSNEPQEEPGGPEDQEVGAQHARPVRPDEALQRKEAPLAAAYQDSGAHVTGPAEPARRERPLLLFARSNDAVVHAARGRVPVDGLLPLLLLLLLLLLSCGGRSILIRKEPIAGQEPVVLNQNVQWTDRPSMGAPFKSRRSTSRARCRTTPSWSQPSSPPNTPPLSRTTPAAAVFESCVFPISVRLFLD